MARSSRMLVLSPFAEILVLNINFSRHMLLVRMVLLRERIILFVRWLGRCLMSIGLLGSIGLRRSIPRAMFQIAFSFVLSRRKLAMNSFMGVLPKLAIFIFLVASVSFSRKEIWTNLSRALTMAFFLAMLTTHVLTVCLTLRLTKSWGLAR